MAFYGSSIIYDGHPSEEFGLMLADVGSAKQEDGKIGGKLTILEDRTSMRHTGLHYGTTQNTALSFVIVLVVDDGHERLDRYDAARVAGWLTGHQQYKDLMICQPDMENICYRCLVTELETIEIGAEIIGFKATMTCDAPYAYLRCSDTIISPGEIIYRNKSNLNDDYLPELVLSGAGADMEITNHTTQETFSLSGMPRIQKTVKVDCNIGLIISDDLDGLYEYWNEVMPRFVRGDNRLSVSGGTLTIRNDYPWSIGY